MDTEPHQVSQVRPSIRSGGRPSCLSARRVSAQRRVLLVGGRSHRWPLRNDRRERESGRVCACVRTTLWPGRSRGRPARWIRPHNNNKPANGESRRGIINQTMCRREAPGRRERGHDSIQSRGHVFSACLVESVMLLAAARQYRVLAAYAGADGKRWQEPSRLSVA